MEASSSLETEHGTPTNVPGEPCFGDLLDLVNLTDLRDLGTLEDFDDLLSDDPPFFDDEGEVDISPTSSKPHISVSRPKRKRKQREGERPSKREPSPKRKRRGEMTGNVPFAAIPEAEGVFQPCPSSVSGFYQLIPGESSSLMPPCGDGSATQVIHTYRPLPQSVINISVPNNVLPAGHTYIIAMSPISVSHVPQVVPLSPVGGTVAPAELAVSIQISSLSESASEGLFSAPAACMSSAKDEVPEKSSASTNSQTQRKQPPEIPECVKECAAQAKVRMKDAFDSVGWTMDLESHYVEVKVVQRKILIQTGKNANKCLEKELVFLSSSGRRNAMLHRSHIFKDSDSRPKQSVALLGKSGMGKTTFFQRLCLDWASDSLPKFRFIFFLDCKTLNLTESRFSLKSFLFDLSISPCYQGTFSQVVFNHILSSPAEVLIIFDHFDDFGLYEGLLNDPATSSSNATYSIKQLFSGLFQKKILSGCTLLMATRPKGVLNQLLRKVDSILELDGFSPEEIESYASKYFKEPKDCERALREMRTQRYIFSLCSSPVLCRSTCFLLEHLDSTRAAFPSTLTGLCQQVLHLHLHLAAQRQSLTVDQLKQDVSQLCGLAREMFKTPLLNHEQGNFQELKDFALSSGILTSHKMSKDGNGDDCLTKYSFGQLVFQSFLCALHMVKANDISDKMLVAQAMHQQRRRRPQGEWQDIVQRFTTGLLLKRMPANESSLLERNTDTQTKREAVEAHLEKMKPEELVPNRLLELFHCVYEASNTKLSKHLVKNLPKVLSFCGTQLSPPDVYVVWHILQSAKGLRRTFSMNLQNTGISLCGLRELVGLSCVKSFRASIADTISLWEDLHQKNEEQFLKIAMDKFTICPFKATQVCHTENLVDLIHICKERRLLMCSSGSDGEEDIPAVKHLQKLEYELGHQNDVVVFTKLVSILPDLQSLKHLDLESNKLDDAAAELLADALVALSSLKLLNLSQNCIGDMGLGQMAPALQTLHSLQSLSVYSNFIADSGAETLASALPHMTALQDLDVKYNKFTDVGATRLSNALKRCPNMRSLGMWNQCIPYGVFEHLQQQDPRIKSL